MSDQRIEYHYKSDSGGLSTIVLTLHDCPGRPRIFQPQEFLDRIVNGEMLVLVRGPIEVPPSREDGKAALIEWLKTRGDIFGRFGGEAATVDEIIERIEAL